MLNTVCVIELNVWKQLSLSQGPATNNKHAASSYIFKIKAPKLLG